jgi:hypothetical protein
LLPEVDVPVIGTSAVGSALCCSQNVSRGAKTSSDGCSDAEKIRREDESVVERVCRAVMGGNVGVECGSGLSM